MRYFYEMYPNAGIHPQLVDELSASENRPQSVDDLESIFYIPWGHNRCILDKCKLNSTRYLHFVLSLRKRNLMV